MVKSTGCLNIIACGKKDSVDRDDLEAPEIKRSSDRRGWSFRKRSATHRVLSNTASSEIPASANKESPESDVGNFQTKPELAVQDKTSSVQWKEEKSDLSDHPNSKLASNAKKEEEDTKVYGAADESSVIILQAASRGFLARRLLLKQKKVIKLQAAVRGHLVRTQAIGTLRCVQAIIKMQALVRERRARLECNGNDNGKNEIKPNISYTYVSLEKLLSNTFARQLMESTPKTTSIRIKCEPLKSDSAWKWLERWMSASSVSDDEPEESEPVIEHSEKENPSHTSTYAESTDIKSDENVSVKESDNDDDLISYEAKSLELKAHKPTSPDQNHSSNDEPKSDPIVIEERDLDTKVEVESSYTKKKEAETELYMPDSKRSSVEQLDETEVKKLSRKASNAAFIAAQSKFEELSLASKLTTSSPGIESGVKPSLDKVSSYTDLQIGGSECGTELSITSTLDSPDRSETIVLNDSELKAKHSDENDLHVSTEQHQELEANGNKEYSQIEDNETLTLTEADPSYPNSIDSEKHETINSSTVETTNTLQDQKPEADQIEYNPEIGSEISHVTCNKSSPEASPRSHMTMPESQATPSSQVSVKPKKNKTEKSKSNGKIKSSSSSSGDKRTPLNRNLDSASSKNGSEHNKTGKRQNSFGSDHKEQEPRDSSGSSSLPSYMQATESARAKAISNGSPRSSPDVNEKDVYLRKRHSLPGAHERHESPRIQRSLSHAQQNVKGNGTTQSPQDRKWRR